MREKIAAIVISIRIQFIVLAVICVFLGVAYARYIHAGIYWINVVVAFVGGVCAHAAVNLLNDWHDTRSGLDAATSRTPFSGGSGALQQFPEQERTVLIAGLVGLLITVLCGVFYLLQGLWGVLPLGIAGLGLIVVYTPWLTRKPLLCLMAPGLAFGPLMVGGTVYVLTGTLPGSAIGLSLIPFFLVNNLLLLNQFPDLAADQEVGRITMPIYAGVRRCTHIIAGFYLAAYGVLAVLVLMEIVPKYCFFAFFTCFFAFFVTKTLFFDVFEGKKAINALKNNVLVTLGTPLIIGVVLLLAA